MPEPEHTRESAGRPHAAGQPAGQPPTGSWHPADGSAPRIGRYEVRALLGEGACGRVYRAFDAELAREVAIKVPSPVGLSWDARERFIREARAAANIHDPYVCPIYDVGTDGDTPYLVMRYVAGGTLADLLNKKLLSPRAALTAAQQLALGVAAAHAEGVIHRDLKPANALWDRTRRAVLVTDFGLARASGDAALTGFGVAVGTPLYMSPEQWEGDPAKIGPLTDVYSLGVILYRLLTGVTPYTGSAREIMIAAYEGRPRPPSALRPELGPGIDALCLRAMAANQAARFPSARAFADAIDVQLRGAGGAEELPMAELIPDAPPAPAPKSRPAPAAIPAPTTPTKGVATDPTPRPPAQRPARLPSPTDASELVGCPRCKARLRIAPTRTTPVPCPMCACLFSVRAGRQAAARAAARPAGGSGSGRAEKVLDLPDDRDDAGPRPEWAPVAGGLSMSRWGMLVAVLFAVGTVAYTVATADLRRPKPQGVSEPAMVHWFVDVGLGLGAAFGLIVVAAGRWRAGTVPARVGGWLAGRLGGVAILVGALGLVAGLALLTWVDAEAAPQSSRDLRESVGQVGMLGGLGWLLVGELLYLRQLGGIAPHVPDFPHVMAATSRVLLLIALVPALVACGVVAAFALGARGTKFDGIGLAAAAISGCLTMAVMPAWFVSAQWVTHRVASAAGRFARGESA